MLGRFGVEILSAADLGLPSPPETGTTFEDNATIKALAATRASGLPALADDSGLSVHALDGQPGLYTADWEGPTRDAMVGMRRIQDELTKRGVPDTDAARARYLPLRAGTGLAGRASRAGARHGRWPHRLAAARQRRARLRSLLPAARRDAHHGRDDRRREERHQPSRPRLPRNWSRPVSNDGSDTHTPHPEERPKGPRLEGWKPAPRLLPIKPRRLLRGNRDGRFAASSG